MAIATSPHVYNADPSRGFSDCHLDLSTVRSPPSQCVFSNTSPCQAPVYKQCQGRVTRWGHTDSVCLCYKLSRYFIIKIDLTATVYQKMPLPVTSARATVFRRLLTPSADDMLTNSVSYLNTFPARFTDICMLRLSH